MIFFLGNGSALNSDLQCKSGAIGSATPLSRAGMPRGRDHAPASRRRCGASQGGQRLRPRQSAAGTRRVRKLGQMGVEAAGRRFLQPEGARRLKTQRLAGIRARLRLRSCS